MGGSGKASGPQKLVDYGWDTQIGHDSISWKPYDLYIGYAWGLDCGQHHEAPAAGPSVTAPAVMAVPNPRPRYPGGSRRSAVLPGRQGQPGPGAGASAARSPVSVSDRAPASTAAIATSNDGASAGRAPRGPRGSGTWARPGQARPGHCRPRWRGRRRADPDVAPGQGLSAMMTRRARPSAVIAGSGTRMILEVVPR